MGAVKLVGRGTNEYIAQVHHMVRLSKAKWTKSTWPLIVSWKPNAPFFHGKKSSLSAGTCFWRNTCCLGWESEKHLYARACVFSLYNYVRRYWKRIDWHFGFYLNLIDLMYFYQFGLALWKLWLSFIYYIYIWIGFSKINILEFNWNICACIKKAHVQYFYFN